MRLSCDISIVSRLAVSREPRNQGKSVRASLAIGRKNGQGSEKRSTVFLLVCTAKERNGTKYKIHHNILQVFNKFIQDGKATIRFNEPSHDLFISKAEPTSLKSFLSVLKLSARDIERVTLSSLTPAKLVDLEKPKTELVVKKRADYPLTKSFPDKVQKVTITNCNMKCFDRRILNLKELTSLCLAGNTFNELPLGLAKMRNLSELYLVNNKIKEFHWGLCSGLLATTLKLLDLRDNEIQFLPSVIYNLQNLIHLKLDGNGLHLLPQSLGRMSKLRFLSVSSNKLRILPISMKRLRLDTLDISNNQFLDDNDEHVVCNLHIPSLLELAGKATKKHRCQYNSWLVPSLLCEYLDGAKQCPCGEYCFQSCIHRIFKINIHHIAHTIVSADSTQSLLPAEGYLCSQKCLFASESVRARHVY